MSLPTDLSTPETYYLRQAGWKVTVGKKAISITDANGLNRPIESAKREAQKIAAAHTRASQVIVIGSFAGCDADHGVFSDVSPVEAVRQFKAQLKRNDPDRKDRDIYIMHVVSGAGLGVHECLC